MSLTPTLDAPTTPALPLGLRPLVENRAALEKLFKSLGATLHHPVCLLPEGAQVAALLLQPGGKELLLKLIDEREEKIRLMATDPLRHGYELPWWKDAQELLTTHEELLVLGGNDSGKSWFSAREGVRALVTEPGVELAFFHSTEDSSKRQQQQLVYRYLPPEWRTLGKKGAHINVTFNDKTGFTDNAFVLPNGSRAYFFFYKQDPGVIAGYKLRGVCGDELITKEHLEEIRTRLLGRNGKLVLTFTPIDGYTPAVAEYLAGAKIVQTRPARFLPNKNFPNRPEVPDGHMPYILQCRRSSAAVICVFTEWSPFRKTGDLERLIEGKALSYVKIRAYGWADKTVGNAFPKFGEVNIIKRNPSHSWNGTGLVPPKPWLRRRPLDPFTAAHEAMTQIRGDGGGPIFTNSNEDAALYPTLPQNGTNYVVADPGGDKNWFIKWYRCAARPAWTFVYREWPPASTHGPWAEPTKSNFRDEGRTRWDGYPGAAQRYDFDPAIIRYKKLVLEAEGWVWDEEAGEWNGEQAEPIYERYIDPAMGGAPVPSADEATSIIGLMEDEQHDQKGRLVGPSMIWLPAKRGASAIHKLQSLEKFNSRLHYNMDQPVNALNCPSWYVVDACEQTIYAMREYTGLDGEKGALKDVVDPDWYFDATDLGFMEAGQLGSYGGGSY